MIRGPLSGKTVLVTGGTGAVGTAIVRALGDSGARVAVTYLPSLPESWEALRKEAGLGDDRLLGVPADLSDEAGAEAAVRAAVERFGGLYGLVNAVGGFAMGPAFEETPLADWEAMWRLNVATVANTCRAALPEMRRAGSGRIVNFGSRNAVQPGARAGPYSAAKAAVVALTGSLAAELKGSGVTANALLPSTIDTPANRRAMPEADHAKLVRPEQIAALILYLLSDQAAAVSGAALPIYAEV